MAVSTSSLSSPAQDAAPRRVYIGTYTGGKSQGIYTALFNDAAGTLSTPALVARTTHPSWLEEHPRKPVLYATGETSNHEGRASGSVSAFRVDPASGELTLLNQVHSEGTSPCHLAVDPDGKFLLVANYSSGTVAAFPLKEDGAIGPVAYVIQHRGSSVNRDRQQGPHAHAVYVDSGRRYALGCDLGLDKVLVYRLGGPRILDLQENLSAAVKPGAGPRHLAFHPSGRKLFVINELDSTLTTMDYDGRGGLRVGPTVSTLPPAFSGDNSCAEVQVHPSGKFVYASNRGHNTIAVFQADGESLAPVQYQDTGGRTPRHFALSPGGKWLLAGNQDSDTVVIFRVDETTGRLAPTAQSVAVGAPVCLLFPRVR